ncbi:hypothetical protein [Streptoalloteichus tenebrarius]|uniref:hypothetical protein n=1 Tax=Streptoalloteichus tenebrarius (strain ATCC 17920 / DSM 40477 / JCM 4838 / CBS 697.72 / NBRC 16177 / NCIMB 11028 / NRRL B-12390 / A12253. 1 / ISP 5477) TaxID=1933 RepID=UPI0020A5015A|nr:hypothetical protein [Streptoalloteichus tenebrarius]BFF02198.1 hypothetical protein GCM10020241_38730 [Streptoalloteichus tenebrarius]
MGAPAWVWFTIAVVAAGAAVALFATDRAQRTARNRERRRWAGLRGWQFAEVDQVLPTRWQHGLIAVSGRGTGRDVVTGSTFTADGRRRVHVLDHEVNGKTTAVLVAVHRRRPMSTVVELWLPSVPVPREGELDLLGPVGDRYAFVSDLASARPLITPDLVDAADEIGDDVTVVWLEDAWVVAAAPANAAPARLERLLRDLGELADIVDPLDSEEGEDAEPDDAVRPLPSNVRELPRAGRPSS